MGRKKKEEVENIEEGNRRPEAGQDPPMLNAREVEVQGGEDNDRHVAPAVEGVEEAHLGLLVPRGAGLGDGGDQHLGQSPTDGVEDDG